MRHPALVTTAALAIGATLVGCSTPATPPATTNGGAPAATSSAPPTTSAPGVTCQYPTAGTAVKPVTAPPTAGVPADGTVQVTIMFGEGPVTMTFDRANAPCAVNSFVSLAQQHYFDGTTCHRLAPNFVIQCGDPSATGRGGPGYRFADELTGKEKYTRGTVAMANSGPNTNGSQFFIVLADAGLPASYTVLGHVDEATWPVVAGIAAKDTDPSGGQVPLHPINVTTVTAG